MIVTALASGSNGNALLVQAGDTALLIDCGLSLRATERYLREQGVEPSALSAVLLTHEHSDHAQSAAALCRRYRLPLLSNAATLLALGEALAGIEAQPLDARQRAQVGAVAVQGFAVPHDAAAPLGLLLACDGWAVGVAVDLGGWDEAIVEALAAADLVVVEANHDTDRLAQAPYPAQIKRRIRSPLGHLDNQRTGALLAQIARDGRPRTAWLGHLSERANSPDLALATVRACLRRNGISSLSLAVAARSRPSARWSSAEQLCQQRMF